MWCARRDSNSRPTGSKPIWLASAMYSRVKLCSVFPNGCAEFGVNSVSAKKPRSATLLLPLVLPVLPAPRRAGGGRNGSAPHGPAQHGRAVRASWRSGSRGSQSCAGRGPVRQTKKANGLRTTRTITEPHCTTLVDRARTMGICRPERRRPDLPRRRRCARASRSRRRWRQRYAAWRNNSISR